MNLLLTYFGAVGLVFYRESDMGVRYAVHGFIHVSKVGFVHHIFSLQDIKATLGTLAFSGTRDMA